MSFDFIFDFILDLNYVQDLQNLQVKTHLFYSVENIFFALYKIMTDLFSYLIELQVCLVTLSLDSL